MSSRRAAVWLLVFAGLAVAGGALDLWGDEPGDDVDLSRASLSGRVVRIVDGDTIHVRLRHSEETVRYIGVDTPETVKPGEPVQCFGKPASEFNRRLVAGRVVRLRFGPERRDRYGRLLAYVYVRGRKGRSVNARLIAGGYGRVLTIEPNSAHRIPFGRLESDARQRGRGLWGSCPAR